MQRRSSASGGIAADLSARRRLLCLCLLLIPTSENLAAPPAAPPRTPLGLDVSLPAAKRLAGARDFIAVGDWEAAVKSLNLLTQDFGETLIEIAPGHAVNARIAASATLAALPAAGLSAYRRRVDATMQERFDEAAARGDLHLMQQLLRDGFASSSGDDALDWLAEDALERGDFDAARAWWTSMLPPPAGAEPFHAAVLRYPDAQRPVPDICARLILCSVLQGDRHRAAAELAVFRERFGDTAGQLAGRRGPLAETLSRVLAESEHWDVSAVRPSAGPLQIATVRWSRAYPSVPPGVAGFGRGGLSGAFTTSLDVIPSLWNDVVLAADSTSVFAFDLANGRPRWPAGPGDDAAIDVADSSGRESRFSISGTPRYLGVVAEDRYFARVGSLVSVPAARAPALPPARLSCYDLSAEGRIAWSITSDELQTLAMGRFSGPPAVDRGRVFVAVRRATPQIEIGLVCCDALTGEILWECRTCTALETPPATRHRVDHDVVATGAGLVYMAPGAGLIAACDSNTGDIVWAVSYDAQAPSTSGASRTGRTTSMLCQGGRLFAMPHDSQAILALDAASGRRLWVAQLPGRIEHMLGVESGRLIAAGDQLWGLRVGDGAAWRFGYDDPEGFGFGRGALAAGRAYWTTRDELFVVDTATGSLLDRVSLTDSAHIGGGNLVVAGNRLLIASPTRLTALGPAADRDRLSD